MSSQKKENNCNRKYTAVKSFSSRVELYFTSLQEPQTAYNKKERRFEILFDQTGNMLYRNVRPPTMSGLCVFLGFHSRNTLWEYEKLGGEWKDVITRARLRIEQSWTELLANKDSEKGAEFALRCHFGWIPEDVRRELEMKEREEITATVPEGVGIVLRVQDCSEQKKIAEESPEKV